MSTPSPPRPPQRIHPSRGRTWRGWLAPLPALAVTGYVFVVLVKAGRSVPAVAYVYVALALLALAFDIFLLVRGRSMVLVMGAIFGAVAVVSLVPKLALGIALAVATVAAYVGLMLLIAFRQRTG